MRMNYYKNCNLELSTLKTRKLINWHEHIHSAYHSCALSSYIALIKTPLVVKEQYWRKKLFNTGNGQILCILLMACRTIQNFNLKRKFTLWSRCQNDQWWEVTSWQMVLNVTPKRKTEKGHKEKGRVRFPQNTSHEVNFYSYLPLN